MKLVEVKKIIKSVAQKSSAEKVSFLPYDWVIEDYILKNSRTGYFNIGLYAVGDNQPCFLMQQRESALVMLLLSKVNGNLWALLNLRFELGLIGNVNLITAIQSTQSNYLRKHGGKATPFTEMYQNPDQYGEVWYDARQFDWGDYYIQKTKRLLIIYIEEAQVAPNNYTWIEVDRLKELVLFENLITCDLRVMLTILKTKNRVTMPEDSANMIPVPFDLDQLDSRGIGLGFFKATSNIREVISWIQPLLIVPVPKLIVFFLRSKIKIV